MCKWSARREDVEAKFCFSQVIEKRGTKQTCAKNENDQANLTSCLVRKATVDACALRALHVATRDIQRRVSTAHNTIGYTRVEFARVQLSFLCLHSRVDDVYVRICVNTCVWLNLNSKLERIETHAILFLLRV